MILFIPVKENSQRVPQKNFRIFKGEPLYKHTLLKYSSDSVYVDTDSDTIEQNIKNDPRLAHVKVLRRPSFLCGDTVSVVDLLKNFVDTEDITTPVVQLHVTSPFLNRDTVYNAYQSLGKQNDSVAACNFIRSRIWRKEDYGVCPVNHNPIKMEQTQDLPVFYEENSAFYIMYPSVLKEHNSRLGITPCFYEVRFPENVDIDTESDWDICQRLEEAL